MPQGFVVLAGSTAVKTEVSSLHSAVTKTRRDLKEQAVLVEAGEFFRFTQDYEFTSLSKAAASILGSSANGREFWKDKDGVCLKELQEQSLQL